MKMHWIASSVTAVAFAAFMTAGSAQAAMYPAVHFDASDVQHIDCAAGLHIGPVGGCILGTDEHHDSDRVNEHRAADEGCDTKSVKRTDAAGNSETKTKTNCN
jgi:hypothetical protein